MHQEPQVAEEKRNLKVGRVAAPLRGQVLDVLREAILDFHYKPGQRLIERELIEEVGVSRTTIREVLRELEAEGLVETVPQKGAIVVVPTAEKAEELYEVRSALEQLAVRNFVARASDAQVKRLREASDEFARTVAEGGDSKTVLKAKDRFYDALLDGSGNEEIRNTLGGLQARVQMLRATSMSNPGRTSEVVRELDELVRAIENGDADTAAAACAFHLDRARENGIKGLSELTPDD